MDLKSVLNDIKHLNEHKSIADNQRNSYNYCKSHLPNGSILIELDWKQKLLIGLYLMFLFFDYFIKLSFIEGTGRRQISEEFRNKQLRSLIGFGIYYVEEGAIKCMNIDLISRIPIHQNGYDSICAFR